MSKSGSALVDLTTRRQAELTQTLAAFATIEPALVVELVRKLRPGDLVDERSRKFLLALKPECEPFCLPRDLVDAVEFTGRLLIACDNLWEIPSAAAAVDAIKRLVVTRQTLTEMQGWLAAAERIGEWHG